MYTQSQNYAKLLFERADDKMLSRGLKLLISSELIVEFRQTIDNIAKTTNYTLGEKIIPSDLERIKGAVVPMLSELSSRLAIKAASKLDSQEARTKTQFLPDLLIANDYFFAYALNTLGNPSIPANFGKDIENKISELALKADFDVTSQDFAPVTTDKYFDAQRKINAKDLKDRFKTLGSPLKLKKATPFEIAKYAAEYQALKRRQAGHGAIWRFFHKSENNERTELLDTMKETLEDILGKNAEIDTKTPKELTESFHEGIIKARMEKESAPNGICVRCDNFDTTKILHEPKDDTRARAEEQSLNVNINNADLSADLQASLNANRNNAEISAQVNEEPMPKALGDNAIHN